MKKNYMSYVLYEHLDGLLLLDDFIPPTALNFHDSEPWCIHHDIPTAT